MYRGFPLALSLLLVGRVAASQQPETVLTPNTPALVPYRVIVRVTDLAKSIAFYRDQAGVPLQ